MRRHRLPGHLHDEVRLKRVQVLLVGGAHAPREALEALAVEELPHGQRDALPEEVHPEAQHARHELLVVLPQRVEPPRHDEPAPDVQPPGNHAEAPVLRGHEERVVAAPARRQRPPLAAVLALGHVEVRVTRVRRHAAPRGRLLLDGVAQRRSHGLRNQTRLEDQRVVRQMRRGHEPHDPLVVPLHRVPMITTAMPASVRYPYPWSFIWLREEDVLLVSYLWAATVHRLAFRGGRRSTSKIKERGEEGRLPRSRGAMISTRRRYGFIKFAGAREDIC